MRDQVGVAPSRSAGLVEILDRVLDKGLVVAGDIQIKLADIELLTIRIRLIVCSLEKAEELGIDWWRRDTYFSNGAAGPMRKHVRASARSARTALKKPVRRRVGHANSERVKSQR